MFINHLDVFDMKIYGIAKEYWGGSSYTCVFNEDIELYISKEKRDEQMEEYNLYKVSGDIIYTPFDIETED